MPQEWFTLSEIAPQAGEALPSSLVGLRDHADKEGWTADAKRCRMRWGKGGGHEYHVSLLPTEVRVRLTLAQEGRLEPQKPLISPSANPGSALLWQSFDRLPQGLKDKALSRLACIQAVEAAYAGGATTKQAAVASVAAHRGVSPASLWNWLAIIDGVPVTDRLPVLAPRYQGRASTVDCDPRAWDFIKSDYLRPSQPGFEACYRRLQHAAAEHGWSPVPSSRTLKRRLEKEVPRVARELARGGEDAARRMLPTQRRDRSHFQPLQAVNGDGHRFDVFVKWEDGSIERPVMLCFQDLYSGAILSHRLDRTENWHCTRLALADLVEQWGIPEKLWLDNGRQFASKWMTGGAKTRFRFKIREDEPQGIITALGIETHWTTPYRGQSKPIERCFRDLCETIAKHPRCQGAYTGNSPSNKPADYGSSSVPIAEFRELVEREIAAHNAREGRRTLVAQGRSFLRTLHEALPDAMVRKASPAQRRILLLAADSVTARKPSGIIELMGTRYHDEALFQHIGQKLIVRFDPENLSLPIAVYTLDNRLICEAAVIDNVAFDDVGAAREHARAQKQRLKGIKTQLDAERRLDAMDVARLLQGKGDGKATQEPPAPASKVTRLVANSKHRLEWDAADDFARGLQAMSDGDVIPFVPKTAREAG